MQKQLKHFCCFPNTAALSCVLLVFFVKRIQIYFLCSVHCLLGVCCWWTIKWWQNRHNVFDFFIFVLKIFLKKYFLLWPSFKSIRRYLLFRVLWLRYLRFLENTYSIFWLRITTIGEDFLCDWLFLSRFDIVLRLSKSCSWSSQVLPLAKLQIFYHKRGKISIELIISI